MLLSVFNKQRRGSIHLHISLATMVRGKSWRSPYNAVLTVVREAQALQNTVQYSMEVFLEGENITEYHIGRYVLDTHREGNKQRASDLKRTR